MKRKFLESFFDDQYENCVRKLFKSYFVQNCYIGIKCIFKIQNFNFRFVCKKCMLIDLALT